MKTNVMIVFIGVFLIGNTHKSLAREVTFQLLTSDSAVNVAPGNIAMPNDWLTLTADDSLQGFNPDGALSFNLVDIAGIMPPSAWNRGPALTGQLVLDIVDNGDGSAGVLATGLVYQGKASPVMQMNQFLILPDTPAAQDTSIPVDGLTISGVWLNSAAGQWSITYDLDSYFATNVDGDPGPEDVDAVFSDKTQTGYLIPVSELTDTGLAAVELDDPTGFFAGDFEAYLQQTILPLLPEEATYLLITQMSKTAPEYVQPGGGLPITTNSLFGNTTVAFTTEDIYAPDPVVTLRLTDGDPGVLTGSLDDTDQDQTSQISMSPFGTPSKPYISTISMGTFYARERRALAEYSLEALRKASENPQAIQSASLTFYFDDVIFPDDSPLPYTTQAFAIELFTDTANVAFDASDPNDTDAQILGTGLDDWSGGVIQRWEFQAGQVDVPLVPGNDIMGIFGPDESYPANYGDDELALFGMIGFRVDVTEQIRTLYADPYTRTVGFRWINLSEGGFWTSMDPEGFLPTLEVSLNPDAPLVFTMQSDDKDAIVPDDSGRLSPLIGRPYHQIDGPNDTGIYLTVNDWQGGHDPDEQVTWPLSDGIINWPVFSDPNHTLDAEPALTAEGKSVYWDEDLNDYILAGPEDTVAGGLEKVYYLDHYYDSTLLLANNGIPTGGSADRQYALLCEFSLAEAQRWQLDPNALTSARLELTIDRVIDMSLQGNREALLPALLFVNAYDGDGLLDTFENVQTDFERIDHANADLVMFLTMDQTETGPPITDLALATYRLVDPGLGTHFVYEIDVTELVRQHLATESPFTGFALSCSGDGAFVVGSLDDVDVEHSISYLPKLVLETSSR
jgi:hypothetical protein